MAARPTGACMRTGKARHPRGFTYLAVLFLVAITAAGLAALGRSWTTAAQRERERELEFRGGEIARAIASYARATPNPPAHYPKSWDDLLEDRRGLKARHHLRRLYPDPFTGQADWELVPEPGRPGAFSAVRSRSGQAMLRQTTADARPLRLAKDWLFAARAYETPGGPGAVVVPVPAASTPNPR